MSRELKLEELREDASELIAAIENGESLTITREGAPVATVNVTRRRDGVRYPFRDFDWGPRPKNLDIDPAQVIIDERERERSLKKYGL